MTEELEQEGILYSFKHLSEVQQIMKKSKQNLAEDKFTDEAKSPLILMIDSGRFKNWVISIVDIKMVETEEIDETTGERFGSIGFNFAPVLVPNDITDADIENLGDSLKEDVAEIFNDIMRKTVDHARAVVTHDALEKSSV